ncbi:MAG: hypothetical protein ACXWUG_06825 [Polyangiales bacterium]
MHVVPPPDPNDPAQPVINAVVAHVLRWGRAPRILVAMKEADALVAELRRRELEVVVVEHARDMHEALRAHFSESDGTVDMLVTSADLRGCAPYHAIAWARRSGFTGPILVAASPMDVIARQEATEVAFDIAPRSLLLPSIDRTLLRSLRKIWSERPSAAA